MSEKIFLAILYVIAIFFLFFISYMLAQAGEPRSRWLICDVMNLQCNE